MRFIIVILIVLLGSCSAQERLNRKYKRLKRFAEKHNLNITDSATVVIHDTIVTETIRKDTVFFKETFYERLRDTIVINNDRLTIRQHYNHTRDSIIIEGECKGDTTYIEKEVIVPVDKPFVVEKEKSIPWWLWVIIAILGGTTFIAILKK